MVLFFLKKQKYKYVFDAITPEKGGNIYVTGLNKFEMDKGDPIKHGFRIV